MLRTAFSTTCAPASAFSLVRADAPEAASAFFATSRTVAFISFMEAAASASRWADTAAPLSDCWMPRDRPPEMPEILPTASSRDRATRAMRSFLSMMSCSARFRAVMST